MAWQALLHARPKWTHTRLIRGTLGRGKGINTSWVVTREISQGVRLQITQPPSTLQFIPAAAVGAGASLPGLRDVSDLSKDVHQALSRPLSLTIGLPGSALKVPKPLENLSNLRAAIQRLASSAQLLPQTPFISIFG